MSDAGTTGHGGSPRGSEVGKARRLVIVLGFGWLAGLVVYTAIFNGGYGRDFSFLIIGILFMATIFGIPSIVLAILLPTYRTRLFLAPVLLYALYFCIIPEEGRSSINFPSPWKMVPWVLSLTAVTLVIPELPLVREVYRRILGLRRS